MACTISIMLTLLSYKNCCFQRDFCCPEVELRPSHVCFIDPSMFQTVLYSRHWTDDIFTCDLQGAVTLPWMKCGDDDNAITRSQPYLWNYFQACLSCLLYKWLQQSCLLFCSHFCLITPAFVFRRENECWRTKKRRERQMQVRRHDPVISGADFWGKGVCRVQKRIKANTLVLHLICPTCLRRFGAAGSVMKLLTGPVKTLTRVIP